MNITLFYREIFIFSTVEGLNECLDVVNEVVREFNFNFEESFALHTVVVESVENAIIHGNSGVRDFKVRVLISVNVNEILIEVEDEGNGFDISSISSPIEGSNIYKESGRGIYFIKKLSSTCYTLGRGNIMRIKIER
jgi:anti-sigma regulatory factor (Ser/Thr protein kinase)